jgi:hypothetical protein
VILTRGDGTNVHADESRIKMSEREDQRASSLLTASNEGSTLITLL